MIDLTLYNSFNLFYCFFFRVNTLLYFFMIASIHSNQQHTKQKKNHILPVIILVSASNSTYVVNFFLK